MAKFIFSLGGRYFETLKAEAEARGIKVQQLIRAIIIRDWIRQNLGQGLPPRSPSSGGNSPISQSPVGRPPSSASNMLSGERMVNQHSSLYQRSSSHRTSPRPVQSRDASRGLPRNGAIEKGASRIFTNLSSKNLHGEKATSSS